MPSTTPGHDIPYMVDGDPLADVATIMQALAEQVEEQVPLVQSGTVSVPVGASTAEASAAVVFPKPFAAPPVVTVSQGQGTNAFYGAPRIDTPTTTGVNVYAAKTSTSGSSTIKCYWIAVGAP